MIQKLKECVLCGALLSKKEAYELDDIVDFPKKLMYEFEGRKPLICQSCLDNQNRLIRNKSIN